MIPYLQITGLSKYYNVTRALDDVSFSLERGSVLALLGPNGAGKSTLFGCLLGLALPTRGEIRLSGHQVTDSDRIGFGYLPERVSLYPQRTVIENAAFFVGLKGHSLAEVEAELERVGLLYARDRKVRQLSKGMLQRLGLAIALCGQPELLVLDEPFNGLDPALLDTLQAVLREENERGATLLISTHTMSAVEPLATHVAVLLQGKVAAFDTLAELRNRDAHNESLEQIYHRLARERHEVLEACA
jgi:ABC-type multidrug transport system ATPase subunit